MKERSFAGGDSAGTEILELPALLAQLDTHWNRPVVVRCGVSFVYAREGWLTAIGQDAKDQRNRIALEDGHYARYPMLFPVYAGGAAPIPRRVEDYAFVVIAGVIRPTRKPGFVAEMTDFFWFDKFMNERSDAGTGWVYSPEHVVRRSLSMPNPGLDPGRLLDEVLCRRAELYGREVRFSGVVLARAPEKSEGISVIATSFEETADPARRVLIETPNLYDRARRLPIMPGVSRDEVWPDKVVKAILSGRLEAADPKAAAAALRNVSEACLTTDPKDPPDYYNCYRLTESDRIE